MSKFNAQRRQNRRPQRPVRIGFTPAPAALESLEPRELFSVTSAIVAGVLTITGDAAADTVTLDHSGKFTFVNGKAFDDSRITGGITIDTGAGNDTVDVRRVTKDTLVQTGAGADTFKMGSNGLTAGVTSSIDLRDSGGTVAVTVDDSADTVARNVILGANDSFTQIQITASTGVLSILDGAAVTRLTVNGGSGGNSVSVDGTHPHTLETILNTGTGADDVQLRGNSSLLIIHGQNGKDQVTVGRFGNTAPIKADVTIDNLGGFSDLTVDDSDDDARRNIALNVADPDAAGNVFGSVTSLAAGDIRFNQRDTESLRVLGARGGNDVFVFNTASNTHGLTTTLVGGDGNDTVRVNRTRGRLNIDGGGGLDQVFLGVNGRIKGINGLVDVRNDDPNLGLTQLTLDDSTDNAGTSPTLAAEGNLGVVTGLAGARIQFRADQLTGLSILTGLGDDHVTVADVNAAVETQILTGGGVNTVDVRRTTTALRISGEGAGRDTVNLGQGDSVRNLFGDVTVTHAGGFTNLNVNDQADAAARVVEMTVDNAQGLGTITKIAPATIRYGINDIANLTVNAGSGGNVFQVLDFTHAAGLNTVLNTGTGIDTVRVSNAFAPLTINGQAGRDTVTLGNGAHDTTGLRADVTITNAASFTSLTVDDADDDAARNVRLDVQTGPGGARFGVITGLGTGTIRYKANDLAALTVLGGRRGNTFTVADTANNGISPVTTIRAGAGDDTVTVQRTTGALTVQGQAGDDRVDLGLNGNAQGIAGDVSIGNAGGTVAITVDDRADISPRTVTLTTPFDTPTTPAGPESTVLGLTPAAIRYTTRDLASLTLRAGDGGPTGNTFNVNNTAPGRAARALTTIQTGDAADRVNVFATTGALTVDAGAGNDTVTLGNFANSLSSIQGTVLVNAGDGADTLTLNDQGGGVREFTETPTSVRRDGAATVNFNRVETLAVNKAAGSTTATGSAPQVADLAFTKTVKPGKVAKLAGRLVDKDKKDKLTLTVDWGDGAAPQIVKPGRAKFLLKHGYAKPGKYNVRLVWTDNTGKSNAQIVKLTVKKASVKAPKPKGLHTAAPAQVNPFSTRRIELN